MLQFLKRVFVCASLLFAFALVLFVYICSIERNLLVVKEDQFTFGDETEVNVVQFSDVHLGEYYSLEDLKRVVKKVNKVKADIIVFTGDLIDCAATYDQLYDIADVLKEMKATAGKFAIYGNHDIGGGAIRHYENIMEESGFTVLKNTSEKVKVNGKTVHIFGGDDGLLGNHNAQKTMSRIEEDECNILLIHEPDLMDEYEEYPIDLTLSGHSHGGQVYIPFYGPIKRNVLSEKYPKGLYQFENSRNTKMYVSSGLGNTKVPFRFGNIPEIKVFHLSI